jgi:protease I
MAAVAFIVDDLFEDSELRIPYDRVREAGHEPVIVGPKSGVTLTGKREKERVEADRGIDEVRAEEFAALVIPGGYSPDKLRMSLPMVRLVRNMCLANKPVAAVCHGPWMLIEADVADGHTLTSWPSLKTDLLNAGARWVDREVVEDGNLITSRKPEDLEAFSSALLRQLEEGPAQRIARPRAPEVRA